MWIPPNALSCFFTFIHFPSVFEISTAWKQVIAIKVPFMNIYHRYYSWFRWKVFIWDQQKVLGMLQMILNNPGCFSFRPDIWSSRFSISVWFFSLFKENKSGKTFGSNENNPIVIVRTNMSVFIFSSERCPVWWPLTSSEPPLSGHQPMTPEHVRPSE